MFTRRTWEVYAKTIAVCIAVCLANKVAESYFQSRIREQDFRWAVAFIAVQSCAVACLSLYLLSVRGYTSLSRMVHGHIRPAIQDRVLALAFEGESWSSNVPKTGLTRRVLEGSVAQALTILRAEPKDRIARFAIDQGFHLEWMKSFSSQSQVQRKRAISLLALIASSAGETILPVALTDECPAIRALAYRGLLILGDPQRIPDVFRSLLHESYLVRALTANDLKRHAHDLLAETIPSILRSGSEIEIRRCFKFMIAWQTAFPGMDILPWTTVESNRRLWPWILALLPYVHIDESIENFVIAALNSNDLAVQSAAAEAAGRLKLERLLSYLSAALSRERPLAVAAANALAQMGERGQRTLEQIIAGADQNAAAFAMEALERMVAKFV